MTAATIVENKVQCVHCKQVIVSAHRHEFVTCQCGAVSVDGGNAYLRRVFRHEGDYIELSDTSGRTLMNDAYQDAPRATEKPAQGSERQIPCRLCNGHTPALAIFALSRGCFARPEDHEQALCGQHIMKATAHGSMELRSVLLPQAYAEFIQFWNQATRPRLLPPEESEGDGVKRTEKQDGPPPPG